MANVSAQSTRSGGAVSKYAKKDAVALSALNASVPIFEDQLKQIRVAHGKDGVRPLQETDGDGRVVRDEHGEPVITKDIRGHTMYEPKYVQAYSVIESFGHDELDPDDPDDPDSWEKAQQYGRALAADRAPGHPALIATEVNGRSGCVHNHIIVGAVHPETGKSIDSNVFTHSRLAIAHDRVLAEQGFVQREDMREITAAAEEEIAQRRQEVLDTADPDLSESQLNRRLLAAENKVTLQIRDEKSESQVRDERRMREFDRHQLTEQDREIALDIGITPPKQRFSELELEARITDSLHDPRSQSWEDLQQVGREHGVTIDRRGKDMTYGMILADSEGELAEPARAHRRRGKGLGEGFRVDDVEASIERNAQLQTNEKSAGAEQNVPTTAEVMEIDTSFLDAHRRGSSNTRDAEARLERVLEDMPEPEPELAPEPEPTPKFRSGLRGVKAKGGSSKTQQRIDEVAELEEDYQGQSPDYQFERRLTSVGVGERFLDHYGQQLGPELREQLQLRQQAKAAKDRAHQMMKDAEADQKYFLLQAHREMDDRVQAGDYQAAIDLRSAEPEVEEAQAPVQTLEPALPASPAPEETAKPTPERRRERQVRALERDHMRDAELIAVVGSERADGSVAVDFQLAAHDPGSIGQSGLHLYAAKQEITDGVRKRTRTTTSRQLTQDQHAKLQDAAGANRTEVDGTQVLAVRGKVTRAVQGRGYIVNPASLKSSKREPIGSDVMDKQRASEDRSRERVSDSAASSTETTRSAHLQRALDRNKSNKEVNRKVEKEKDQNQIMEF